MGTMSNLPINIILYSLINNKRIYMSEPISITVLIASVGSLLLALCDKMRHSRCNRIICCGCCEVDRIVEDEETDYVSKSSNEKRRK